MSYIGKTTDGFGVRNRFVYLASSGDTSVSGADANGATLTFTDGAYVDVYLNGVLLKPGTDYNTTTANTIAGISSMAADDEVTYRRNTKSFDDVDIVPNVIRGVEDVDLTTTVFGKKINMPIYCSPTAVQRLFHFEG